MSVLDKKYDIKFANLNDVDKIMSFIEKEWKSNHILATNRDFFLYEFADGNHIHMIVAENRETKELDGILGYLPASRDEEYLDIWGVMWKVTDKRHVEPFLGIELMKRLIKETRCRTEIGIGANPKTSIPLLKMMLGFWIGKMKHYYMISDNKEFKIAKVEKVRTSKRLSLHTYTLKRYNNINELNLDFDFEKRKEIRPYKDSWYVNKRFFNHPIYKYDIYGACNNQGETEAIVICRQVECNGSKILRIVDFIGNQKAFSGLYDAFERMLKEYEYIDFYCYGLEDEYIKNAGFIEKDEQDVNIIPNYFEPFVQCNVDIWVNSSNSGCVFFKADGDQDRPNFIGNVN